MSSTAKVTKVTLAQHVRDLIAGTQKHSPNGQLTLGGQQFTAQALIQTLQSLGDALSTVDTAKASWKDALKNLADVKAKVRPLLGAYHSWVVATYGNAAAMLPDFGICLPRRVRLLLLFRSERMAYGTRRFALGSGGDLLIGR